MADLLGVNVLVALFVPEHQHHVIALDWFSRNTASQGWSTCTITELGVIRICAQLPGGGRRPAVTAHRLLMLTVANPGYMRWLDAVSPATLPEVRSAKTTNQVTDRYLLGLARRNGGRIVAFDRALAAEGANDAICLRGGYS